MTITPADVRLNAFLTTLDDDWIAVDENGEVLCRANDEETVRRAVPTAAAYFSGADFKDAGATAEIHSPGLNEAIDTVVAAAKAGAAFDHDGDGKPGGAPKGGNKKKAKP